MRRIYFDHNATTRVHPEVRARMEAVLDSEFGNPSSVHETGRAAREQVETARREVAALVGGAADEIVFCSGGTEADNLAVRGLARAARAAGRGAHVITSAIEHPAVLGSCAELRAAGFGVTVLDVDAGGTVGPQALAQALRPETVLCSIQLANHELGTVQPIAELAALAHERGVPFHTDAVQAVGRVPVDVRALGVDLLALSGHKIHGPKGVGALWVRRELDLAPLIAGGHQERERRPGTENVPGIVGLGAAAALCRRMLPAWGPKVAALRDRLEAGLLALGARRHGVATPRVPGTTNVGWTGVDGELVMMNLDLMGVSVSTGAACTSGSIDASPVLLALGLGRAQALEGVRMSLGPDNTAEEVATVLAALPEILARVRRAAG